jgi:hypothetical protein
LLSYRPQNWPLPVTYGLAAAVAGFELFVLALALSPNVDPNYRAYFIDRTTTCLDKPIPATYLLGSTVSFLPDGKSAAEQIRVCGWTNPVGNGTHSMGTSSRLRVRLDVPPDNLRLVVEFTSSGPQRVTVSANGTAIGSVSLPGSDKVVLSRFPIARQLATMEKALDIEFAYPDAFLPNQRTSDVHSRAVRLLSFKLETADAN